MTVKLRTVAVQRDSRFSRYVNTHSFFPCIFGLWRFWYLKCWYYFQMLGFFHVGNYLLKSLLLSKTVFAETFESEEVYKRKNVGNFFHIWTSEVLLQNWTNSLLTIYFTRNGCWLGIREKIQTFRLGDV